MEKKTRSPFIVDDDSSFSHEKQAVPKILNSKLPVGDTDASQAQKTVLLEDFVNEIRKTKVKKVEGPSPYELRMQSKNTKEIVKKEEIAIASPIGKTKKKRKTIRHYDKLIAVFSVFIIGLFIVHNLTSTYASYETPYSNNINDKDMSLIIEDARMKIDSNKTKLENFNICMTNSTPTELLDSRIIEKINLLGVLLKSSSNNFAFKYEDITTGFSFSYNATSEIYGASTSKIAAVLYLYDLASKAEINLDDKMIYTEKFYNTGSALGRIMNMEYGTEISLRDLAKYAIEESDNIAYTMLVQNLGKDDIKKYWNDKGVASIFKGEIFGNISAEDGTTYFKELYKFYNDNKDGLGKEILGYAINSIYGALNNKNDVVAHKAGWVDKYYHDNALILNENPYVVSILTTRGINTSELFYKELSYLTEDIHNLYHETKLTSCEVLLKG